MHCFAILLALGLTWTGLPAGWAQDDPADEVTVPDAALRAVLEDSLGLSAGAPITEAVLAELTVLEAPDAGIVDLTGLEYATGLTRLDLGPGAITRDPWTNTNAISDLSPLSGLAALTWLDLAGNSIEDVTPLARLSELRWLNLEVNYISDFSTLSGLRKLRDLFVAFNPILYEWPLPEDRMARVAGTTYLIFSGRWILPRVRLNPKLSEGCENVVHEYKNALRLGWVTDRVDLEAPCVTALGSFPAWDLSKPAPALSLEIYVDPGPQENVDVVVGWLEDHGITDFVIHEPRRRYPDSPWVSPCLPLPLVEPLSELPSVALIYWSPYFYPVPSSLGGVSWGAIKHLFR